MESNSMVKLSLPLKIHLQIVAFSLIFDLVRRLFNFLDRKISANPTPHDGVSTHNVTLGSQVTTYGSAFSSQRRPSSSASVPVIVYFQGGGFIYLSSGSFFYDAFSRRLSHHLGVVVTSVNYRLAPEHKLPAQYDDAIDVLRFRGDSARRKMPNSWLEKANVSKCFLAGDGAGKSIAHHMAVWAAEEQLTEVICPL